MRKKDRCGPGITNCAGADGVSPSAEEMAAELECSKETAGACSRLRANESHSKRENATRMDRQTGSFTAGFLSEPARPHVTWNRGRQGVVFVRETEMSPDLGFVKTGPLLQISMWAKIPYIERLSKLFF